ncbi:MULTISPECIES: 4Fe-4S binding protein [Bacillus]|uniref:4Fe-4S ferredoxin n=2 Tax=Bacillus TaxID=1386 RepID=A0A0M4G800_9BACI|nr:MULTISPECIES: 4Fe-4S binding protein [Bacillus]ALC81240.1 4Fe-4S ferredoxin [Bacillus gobiensis]MBP1080236.1 NAD-dependent dihydropyrimidine dehydrogenase PreA subunit [Bacillus capparidis]MED1094104.1 4Fe-4S binding protein [Bacillus capparidis]
MIEVLLEDRCIECNLCVKVCPTNVFDKRQEESPVISRKDDCQTCYMCELYCPVSALYVAPNAEETTDLPQEKLINSGKVGSYRNEIGWGKGKQSTAKKDLYYKFYLK